MKQIVLDAAYKIGIDTIGITDKVDYSHLEDLLADRKKNNLTCEFEEQDINKRLNAKNLFPQCRSIIGLGLPYGEGYKIPSSPDKGLLSVSSHVDDYHAKVTFLLKKLAEELSKDIKFSYRACVDTEFLIDKEICRSAGLGQYGKNSLLINKNKGSLINLGYLLTDIEIPGHNTLEEDICGACSICVKRCPNKAIYEGGGINPKKCISYLSQTKNYIPLEYRPNMGSQIYGCDICQVVCPKNREVLNKKTGEDYSDLLVDLKEILTISKKDFEKKYGHRVGSWRGRNIWKRNALIAIGNLKLISMFDNVREELENPSETIKTYAAWSLLKLNKSVARDILIRSIKYENDAIKNEYLKLLEAQL